MAAETAEPEAVDLGRPPARHTPILRVAPRYRTHRALSFSFSGPSPCLVCASQRALPSLSAVLYRLPRSICFDLLLVPSRLFLLAAPPGFRSLVRAAHYTTHGLLKTAEMRELRLCLSFVTARGGSRGRAAVAVAW